MNSAHNSWTVSVHVQEVGLRQDQIIGHVKDGAEVRHLRVSVGI